MKKILLLLVMAVSYIGTAQFGEKEGFAATGYYIPTIPNSDFRVGVDIEYHSFILIRAGIENGLDQHGEYFDLHGNIGPRFTIGGDEQISLIPFVKIGASYRNGHPNAIAGFGFEANYALRDGFFVGAFARYDYTGDMKSVTLPEDWGLNGGVRIGFWWDW